MKTADPVVEFQRTLAEIVAAIPEGANWRSLSPVQRRAIAGWRTQHAELTYANLLIKGPSNARSSIDVAASVMPVIRSPDHAEGFVRFDPYGTVNTINEAVVNYFNKIELLLPGGGIQELSRRIAVYNGYSANQQVEFPTGQYIWFPGRTVLQQWTHDIAGQKRV